MFGGVMFGGVMFGGVTTNSCCLDSEPKALVYIKLRRRSWESCWGGMVLRRLKATALLTD